MSRKQLEESSLFLALMGVDAKLKFRLDQKGPGSYASIHECLGILEEEMMEFREEVHKKHDREAQVEELKDIAVGAIWAIASIESGGVDW